MSVDVDAIVLDIDGGPMLAECLASIRGASRIVVFDNGSRVPSVAPNATILRSETNLGFARAANEAFRATTAPYVALINNDVVLDPDWLPLVREAMQRDERLAAVQTIIRRPDGRIDGAGIDIRDGTFRQIGHGLHVGSDLAVAWGVSATATLYRRSAVGETLFDERLFTYYEDVELSARLRQAGWRTAVLPVIKATHRGSASAKVLGKDAQRLRTRNRYLVARMHPGTGSIVSLLCEDARLALRQRTSLRGVIEGLWSRL